MLNALPKEKQPLPARAMRNQRNFMERREAGCSRPFGESRHTRCRPG
jgi:hypothetical protein